jgi:hypothetical protein
MWIALKSIKPVGFQDRLPQFDTKFRPICSVCTTKGIVIQNRNTATNGSITYLTTQELLYFFSFLFLWGREGGQGGLINDPLNPTTWSNHPTRRVTDDFKWVGHSAVGIIFLRKWVAGRLSDLRKFQLNNPT